MSYTGQTALIPIGFLGFSGSKNPSQQQAGHFSYVDNVAIDGSLIQKIGGAAKYNSTAAGSGNTILAGAWHVPFDSATSPRSVVFLDDGSIRHDGAAAGTYGTTAVSSLNAPTEPPPVFVSGGGEDVGEPAKLFCFSSSNQVQVSQTEAIATMAAISDPPADWASGDFPSFGLIHEGRLWGGGNNGDPHRIYYSAIDDHEDFLNGGSLPIYPGVGEALVGGVSFKGALILFKYPRGIYLVITSDPSPSGWRVEELSTAVGTVSQHTIIRIDNDVLYLDDVGNIHSLASTNKHGDVQTSNISQLSDLAEFMRTYLRRANIKRCCGLWYGTKQQAWFALPSTESSGNDNYMRLVVDNSTPQVGTRFLLSRRDTPVSMWLQPDGDGVYIPVHGDDAGFVWNMDQEARNKDGSAYTMKFDTANTDLGFLDPTLAVKDKTAEFLEIVYEPQGNWTVDVTMYWDDVPTWTGTFSMGGAAGEVLDVFELDADALSSIAVTSFRQGVPGSGRRVRFEVEQTGDDQNVALVAFYLNFYVMDERNSSNG